MLAEKSVAIAATVGVGEPLALGGVVIVEPQPTISPALAVLWLPNADLWGGGGKLSPFSRIYII